MGYGGPSIDWNGVFLDISIAFNMGLVGLVLLALGTGLLVGVRFPNRVRTVAIICTTLGVAVLAYAIGWWHFKIS